MKEFVSLWCEWDCGQDIVVFTSKDKAKAWLKDMLGTDLEEMNFKNIDDIFDSGLAGFMVTYLIA